MYRRGGSAEKKGRINNGREGMMERVNKKVDDNEWKREGRSRSYSQSSVHLLQRFKESERDSF